MEVYHQLKEKNNHQIGIQKFLKDFHQQEAFIID